MTRRRVIIGCVVAGGLGLLVLVALSLLNMAAQSRINLDNYIELGEGMTRAEVEGILGGPPRNECRHPTTIRLHSISWHTDVAVNPGEPWPAGHFSDPSDGEAEVWVSDEICIAIWFGPDRRLLHRHFEEPPNYQRPAEGFAHFIKRQFR